MAMYSYADEIHETNRSTDDVAGVSSSPGHKLNFSLSHLRPSAVAARSRITGHEARIALEQLSE